LKRSGQGIKRNRGNSLQTYRGSLGPNSEIDEKIIELVRAGSLFTWAGTLNTVVCFQTCADSLYGERGAYATAS
jgi:hypothetical protein